MTLEQLKTKLEDIIDPTINMTLKESKGIKHLGLDDDNNIITIIIGIGKLGGENEKTLRRAIARTVKIDCGFKGLKLQVEESKIYNSITKKPITFIGIISGKGGVGKSSVAVNIAYRMAKRNIKVGIIDADIYGSSVPTLLEIEHTQATLDDEKKIIPIIKNGIEVISTDFFVNQGQPLIWRGGMLNSMISQFFYNVKWQEGTEYVIIDFPPGTGDILLDIKNIVPQTKMIIITTPHPSASYVAVKAGKAATTLGHEILGVIENMSYYVNSFNNNKENIFGEGGGQKIADELNTELIAKLEITQPKSHLNIFEINENNGKIYDDIVEFIIYKTKTQ